MSQHPYFDHNTPCNSDRCVRPTHRLFSKAVEPRYTNLQTRHALPALANHTKDHCTLSLADLATPPTKGRSTSPPVTCCPCLTLSVPYLLGSGTIRCPTSVCQPVFNVMTDKHSSSCGSQTRPQGLPTTPLRPHCRGVCFFSPPPKQPLRPIAPAPFVAALLGASTLRDRCHLIHPPQPLAGLRGFRWGSAAASSTAAC